eukprot:scaffold96313_cov57-Phaeocystis_antarctica.AAC.2
MEAASPCGGGCSPMHPRLQPLSIAGTVCHQLHMVREDGALLPRTLRHGRRHDPYHGYPLRSA